VYIVEDEQTAHRQAEAAALTSGVRLRELHDARDCRVLVDLLNRIWSSPAGEDLIAMGELVALAHAGNYVTMVERGGIPVGGAVGFFGPPGRPLHSHIVGVHPDAAGQGIGRAIKLHQRAWTLDRGVDVMTWTYDPLVARNAYFNIHTLGARPTEYHHDFYGPMEDGINRGQFTDRMVISWDLRRTGPVPIPTAPDGTAPDDTMSHDTVPHVALANDDDKPGSWAPPRDDHRGPVLVGVPRDIEAIRLEDDELAHSWRQETRSAFTDLLDNGWTVRDFRPSGHYVFLQENR
jgi:predicted GNAT superfamily acetyltransferase